MAGHALQGLGGVDELFHPLVPIIEIPQGLAQLQCVVQGDVQVPRPAGHLLGHRVHVRVGHVQHPAHVPDGGPGGHGAEGDDLGHPVAAVLAPDVVHHLVPAVVPEVHVNIRHTHPLRVEESLKVEAVLDGVNIRDAQAVGHHAAGGGAAAGSHGDARLPGKADKVGDNEEVVGEAHLLNHVQLVVQLPAVLRVLPPVAVREPLIAQGADIGPGGLPLRDPELRQVVLAEGELQIALLRDPLRVGQGLGVLGEEALHLLGGAEVEVAGLVAHPLLIVHHLAGLDAQENVVALRVLRGQVVAVVGAHQGDARLLVQAQQALVDHGLTADAVVLELQIEAVRTEDVPQLQGPGLGGGVVAGGQPLGDLPGQTGGQGDEPPAVGAQQVHVHPGLDVEALREGHADHVAEVFISLLVPAQEDQVAALPIQLIDLVKAGPAGGRDVHLAADNGLDALPLAGAVEVNCAVHDPVVCDRHGGLAQLLDPAGQSVDLAEAVQQAVLRVDVEVDKGHRVPLFLAPGSVLRL